MPSPARLLANIKVPAVLEECKSKDSPESTMETPESMASVSSPQSDEAGNSTAQVYQMDSPAASPTSATSSSSSRNRPSLWVDVDKVNSDAENRLPTSKTWGMPQGMWDEMPKSWRTKYTFVSNLKEERGAKGPSEILRVRNTLTGVIKVIKITLHKGSKELGVMRALKKGPVLSPYLLYAEELHEGATFDFMLMPYHRMELFDYIATHGRMTLVQTAHVATCILHALYTMNLCGYVHCDVKPENILITDEGCPILFDFGLSERISDLVSAPVRGTPTYRPIEGFKCSEITSEFDVWSLGITLFVALYGYQPLSDRAVQMGQVGISWPVNMGDLYSAANCILDSRLRAHHTQRISVFTASHAF